MIVKRLIQAWLHRSTPDGSRRANKRQRVWVESLEDRNLLAVVHGADFDSISPAWFESLDHSPNDAEQPSGSSPDSTTQIAWNGQTLDAQADAWIVQLNSASLVGIASVSDAANLFINSGLSVVRGLGKTGQMLVRAAGTAGTAIEELLRTNPAIEYFEPNFIAELAQIPDDASFSQLWGLHNIGQSGGTVDADIDAPEAWEIATGSAGVVVSVIDTGVDYTHPDLATNIWTNPGEIAGNGIDDDSNGFIDDVHGYDFINDDSDPMDDNRHGTHVSGTIAGAGNNSLGVAGVNWSSSIMALKFLSAAGSGSTADAVRAVNYATMMRSTYGINVCLTSNSWGGGGFSQALADAIAASGAAGMLFVAAAGNSNRNTDLTPHYPSSYDLDNLIAVAATDRNDLLASFSNYGSISVDLAAPGVAVFSTVRAGAYASLSGTSMAAPHVAGVAALAWSTATAATSQQIRDAIFAGVDEIPSLNGKVATGGRLNAHRVLTQLGMHVAGSNPAADVILVVRPTDFEIDLSYDYDLSTIQASDLRVNAAPADDFIVVDGNSVRFHFDVSPVSSDGPQIMEVAAGSIHRLADGSPNASWQSRFYYDSLRLAVLSTSPAQGETLVARPGQIVFDFNEPVDPTSIDAADLALNYGTVMGVSVLDGDSVSYQLGNLLREGAVAYTLRDGALLDIHGTPSPVFVGGFVVDDPLITRFESSDVPTVIPDLATASSVLTIDSLLTIDDLGVALSLTHPNVSDLDVFLIAPDGRRIELFTDVGSSGNDMIGMTLDDEAANSITSGIAPFSGRFRPESLLSAVDGYNSLGTWTLQITDDLRFSAGTLTEWALIVTNIVDSNPRINSVQPLPFTGGEIWLDVNSLAVRFSEVMDVATVNDLDNWSLTEAGPDGAFGSLDDAHLPLLLATPYAAGVIAHISIDAGVLSPGKYRLIGESGGLRDLAGHPLDGNGDAVGGDDYVQYFNVNHPLTLIPYLEGFEAGSLAALGGHWQFTAGPAGRIAVSSTSSPHAGSYHLILDQSTATAGPQYATLHVDLTGASGVSLDFWQKEIGNRSESSNDRVQISANGNDWYELVSLTGTNSESTYQHHSISLDEAVAAAGFSYSKDFQIRFSQENHALPTGGFAFDDIRLTQLDVVGARVLTHTPVGQMPGPINTLTVTFSETINTATFEAADVTVTGPAGNPVAPAGDPVDSGDHRTFTINLTAGQVVVGNYTIRIGPDVLDLADNWMNQDNDTLSGEAGSQDVYVGTFLVGPLTPQSFPYTQDFESGNIDTLTGWRFAITGTGTVAVTSANTPHAGSYHLKFDQATSGTKQTDLLLDLSSQAGAVDLALDFWIQALGSTTDNSIDVHVSGDGNNYAPVPQGSNLQPSAVLQYTHYSFDLDAALSSAGIAMDSTVHVRITHTGSTSTRETTLDDFRISNLDVFGPKVLSETPPGQLPGPVSSLSVIFDEAIDAATFTAADVVVTGPLGYVLALAGNPVDDGSHRAFTINFTVPHALVGNYTFRIGPNVRDLAGNAMNQDSDPASGETNGHDEYVGTFEIGPLVPRSFPYTQGFESGDIGTLAGWRLAAPGSGTLQVTSTGSPHEGDYHLKFDLTSSSTQQAILVLDLSDQAGQTDLELDFWLQNRTVGGGNNYVDLAVSGNGNSYLPVPQGSHLISSGFRHYIHYGFDLDAALSAAGISMDSDVYLSFRHVGFSSSEEMTLDDIRISNFDVIGAQVLAHSPTGELAGPVSSFTVTFDEAIDATTFTAADVTITGPGGNTMALTAVPVDSGDHRTFTIYLAAERVSAGDYSFRIGVDVRDLAGNLMNQDNDPASGETDDQDDYLGSFRIGSPAPQSVPYSQGFESGDLGVLPGWSFAVAGAGTMQVTSSIWPHGGDYHLKFNQTAASAQQAELLLDLSGHAGETDLALDFWLQAQTSTSGNSNYVDLHISGDGSSFVPVPRGNLLFPPVLGRYAQCAFDLDAALSSAGIAMDSDVYLRITHTSPHTSREMMLDDLRISNLDVFGAKLLSHTPTGQVSEPFSSFTVTFDEAMNASTFTASDVKITGPAGNIVPLFGDPLDSGDHRTFTIRMAPGQLLAGNYTFRVGPDVRNLVGIPMNQDDDPALGEANGQDDYVGTFQLGPAVPQSFPYMQDFESGNIAALAGWSFTVTGSGTIEVIGDNWAHRGDYYVEFDNGSPIDTKQEAVLVVDLSTQAQATDLHLDFWLQRGLTSQNNNSVSLLVSGDGTAYMPIASALIPTVAGRYTHFVFDLDAVLTTTGISPDGDVYLMFRHNPVVGSNLMMLDDIRIKSGPINNAPTLTTISMLAGALEDRPYVVTYAALAAAANEADVNGQTLNFLIDGVNSGSLTKNGVPIVPEVTLLTMGEELIWTSAFNNNGSARDAFLVRAWDGDLDSGTPVRVQVDVTAVNDPPSFVKGTDQTIVEDAAIQTVSNWATSIRSGPSDEFGQQTLTFLVTNDNNGFFSVQPAIASNGRLTYTPAGNANGTVTVTVMLRDGGGTMNNGVDTSPPQSFLITVNPVNDAPLLDNSGTLRLQPISEGDTANQGTLVSAIISGAGGNRITEVDAGALFGIAVTGVDNIEGAWQFSIDNEVNWADFGAPADSMARLLAADDVTRVRFVPAGNFTGTIVAGISFRAWDRTGSAVTGDIGDTSLNGAVSAFSTTTETAGITINPLTGPPIVDAGGPYAILEGTTMALWGWGTSTAPLDFFWDLDGDGAYGEAGADAVRGDEVGLSPTFNAAGLDGPLSVIVSFRAANVYGAATGQATINIQNAPPMANAGATYSAVGGAAVVLDRAWASDLAGDLDPLSLTWDLDSDGTFGETGGVAARGDEIGLTPMFNAAGLPLGSRNISFRADDGDNGVTTVSTTINIISGSSAKIVDNSDATGFALSNHWAPGGGTGVGRNNNVYVAFGESHLPTDVATWTFDLNAPGRYRVSASWFTNTMFPQLFADAARFEVSDVTVGVVRSTLLMNQKQVPNDFTDAGSAWEDLGSFDIFGSTLQIKLYSTADDQTYVVADAIRVIKIADLSPAAEIQMTEHGPSDRNVPDGTGNVVFGTADFNEPVTKTFTISNTGMQPLTLSGAVSVTGSVFEVITQPVASTLDPGQTTTFQVRMDAGTVGAHSAVVSFANSDGNEGAFDFTVSGTVLATNIIDDGDPEYAHFPAGSFGFLSGPGRLGDHRYTRLITGNDIATWAFSVAPGQYRVSATYLSNGGYDDTAPFTVFDGLAVPGGTVRGGRELNQQTPPNDRAYAGSNWEDVGVVNITSGTLTVQLRGDHAVWYAIADSILIERLGEIPAVPEIVVVEGNRDANAGTVNYGSTQLNHPLDRTFAITNSGVGPLTIDAGSFTVPAGYQLVSGPALTTINPGEVSTFVVRLKAEYEGVDAGAITFTSNDAGESAVSINVTGTVLNYRIIDDQNVADGYSVTGPIQTGANAGAYGGDVSYAHFSVAPVVATWTFSNLTPGNYLVLATWPDFNNNPIWNNNTPITVFDGAQNEGTYTVNQQDGPTFPFAGAFWQQLGGFLMITSTTVTVTMTNVGDSGFMIADAIMLARSGPAAPPGNSQSGAGGSRGLPVAPSSGGALRSEESDAVDQALLATTYWDDELEEVASVLATDPTREDSYDAVATGPIDELEEDKRTSWSWPSPDWL